MSTKQGLKESTSGSLLRKGRQRPRVQLDCSGEPSMTKQSFRDACDINKILPAAIKTGLLTHVNAAQGSVRDLSEAVDYKTGLDLINKAQEAFMELPAPVRREYDNDPGKLLEAVDDPDQQDRLVELGLAEKAESAEKAAVKEKLPLEEAVEASTTKKPAE